MKLIVKIFSFIFSAVFKILIGFVEFSMNFFLDMLSSILAAIDVFGLFSDLFDREKNNNKEDK